MRTGEFAKGKLKSVSLWDRDEDKSKSIFMTHFVDVSHFNEIREHRKSVPLSAQGVH